MTERKNFLERWSRRKLTKGEPSAVEEQSSHQQPEAAQPANDRSETEPFDPASLPPIETIDAKTDVTAFLRPGVPPELTRAALRRAWTSDPAIRDFIGLAENSWDFNDPQAMHGFGSLDPAEAARLFSQAVEQVLTPSAKAKIEPMRAASEIEPTAKGVLTDERAASDDVRRSANDAMQKESDS